MKILFVEDNDTFAEALMDMLVSFHFQVVRKTHIEDAQIEFDQGGIDLVITDLHLKPQKTDSRTSGIDLIHYIRHRKKSQVPIIVTTGLELITAEDILSNGANIFFHKGKLQYDEFLSIINYLLMVPQIDHKAIFHAISGLYLILNPDFTIIEVSEAYLKATMTRRQEIMGRNIFKVFPDNPNDPKADGVRNLKASLNRVKDKLIADTMAVQKYDIPKPDTDGEEFEERYWSPMNSPVLNEQGHLKYIIHRVTDVTDFIRNKKNHELQLKFNNALQEQMNRMEMDIYEQAKEVQSTNDKLRQLNHDLNVTSQRLKDVNNELEAFSYSVSHDLRAPLRSIHGFSRVLQEEYHSALDSQGQDYLNRIKTGTEKMGHLIDDLIRLAHFSKIEIHPCEVNLSRLAEEIIQELQQQEPNRLLKKVIPTNIIAIGDRGLIRSLLSNLLNNAWKFTKQKEEAYIELGVSPTLKGPVYYVKDNGTGFDMKYAQNLFGAFQRLHSNKEFPGSGIGLAAARRIISRHGGSVWAYGEVNQGATIFFTLGTLLPLQQK